MNKILLIGNLGRSPAMQYTQQGVARTHFSLAVNRVSRSSTGERQEETLWFEITAWRQLAETCNTYLHKGQKIYIEGRLSTRTYKDRNNVLQTVLEVTISDMEMVTPKDPQNEEEESDENGHLQGPEDGEGADEEI